MEAEPDDGLNEAQVEEILRRYVEESRQYAPKPAKSRWEWFALAACVLVVLIIVLFAQIGSLKSTMSDLRGQLSYLDNRVSSNLSNISSQIQNEIRDVLAEEAQLLNTCQWELLSFDLDSQTATVRFSATLKDYSAGSRMQFLVDWVKTDQTEGQSVSDFAEGPDFSVELTLPMNYHSEISIRVEDADGNIREQLVDYIYSLHPDSFRLEAYNLMKPFVITISQFGSTSITLVGEQVYVDIFSPYPELFWPEEAVITAWVNGKEVLSEQMTITPSEDSSDMFCAAIEGEYYELTMKNGDQLQVMVQVTDNLGRTEEFWSGAAVNNGELDREPMVAPAVRAE